MSLNDQIEKLDLAEQYMIDYQARTQEFAAALEHVRWAHKEHPELRPRCMQIILNVAAEAEKRREFSKVKELSK